MSVTKLSFRVCLLVAGLLAATGVWFLAGSTLQKANPVHDELFAQSAFVLSFAFYFSLADPHDPKDAARSARTLELANRQGEVVSYIEDSLSAGERIESIFKLHWFAWVPVWLWALLAIPTIGLTLFVALYVYLQLRFTEQGVTNKRVILKKGVISRKTEEMKLTSIETVEIQQGIWGRIFGFGSVKVTGRGISNLVYKGIDDPMAVKRQIESVSNPSP